MSSLSITTQAKEPRRLCILYHYFEADPNYRINFQHFLTFGIPSDADVFCILAGPCTIELPALERVSYLHTENKNWDYGGYAMALQQHVDSTAYDYFVFINSSVRGPFLPPGSHENWLDRFFQYADADVGIIGSTIAILGKDSIDAQYFQARYPNALPPYAHVQSTAYMLSAKAMQILQAHGFYERSQVMHKADVICHYEIRMSQLLIENGLNLKCLLPEYNRIDYRLPYSDPNPTSYLGDPSTPDGYFGRTIHPYEGLFIKTQRALYPNYYLELLTQSMLANEPARISYLEKTTMNALLRSKHQFDGTQSMAQLVKKIRRAIKRYWKTLI